MSVRKHHEERVVLLTTKLNSFVCGEFQMSCRSNRARLRSEWCKRMRYVRPKCFFVLSRLHLIFYDHVSACQGELNTEQSTLIFSLKGIEKMHLACCRLLIVARTWSVCYALLKAAVIIITKLTMLLHSVRKCDLYSYMNTAGTDESQTAGCSLITYLP